MKLRENLLARCRYNRYLADGNNNAVVYVLI